MLKLNDLRVTISGFNILRGVNLEISPGGLVLLAGRNGAGKTTTLKSIMGILPLTAGSIHFDGEDILHVAAHLRAPLGIGYMPEERRLIGALTVRDNILLPAWACKIETADERLDYIYRLMPELSPFVNRRASMLSGGQQKMVALARALMSGTKLLLLDEPFEGLSPGLGVKIGEKIQQLQQDGLTVLMAESDVKRIDFADKTYMIERGETVDDSGS
ncbi:MAG TPA: ATP-binding cassette domain-containing protein [Rhodospirillales bacterium]|jgi:branched-chain amino acid transport system ATP-binding protein|nr:ATP-binding cassette domain-containing protein [Rhodospirillales bacterium]